MKSSLTHCRQPGCAAGIYWATTDSDRAMPVDAQPNPAGNLAVWRDGNDNLHCRVVTPDRPLNPSKEIAGMPHWSTCLNPPRRETGS